MLPKEDGGGHFIWASMLLFVTVFYAGIAAVIGFFLCDDTNDNFR